MGLCSKFQSGCRRSGRASRTGWGILYVEAIFVFETSKDSGDVDARVIYSIRTLFEGLSRLRSITGDLGVYKRVLLGLSEVHMKGWVLHGLATGQSWLEDKIPSLR